MGGMIIDKTHLYTYICACSKAAEKVCGFQDVYTLLYFHGFAIQKNVVCFADDKNQTLKCCSSPDSSNCMADGIFKMHKKI